MFDVVLVFRYIENDDYDSLILYTIHILSLHISFGFDVIGNHPWENSFPEALFKTIMNAYVQIHEIYKL